MFETVSTKKCGFERVSLSPNAGTGRAKITRFKDVWRRPPRVACTWSEWASSGCSLDWSSVRLRRKLRSSSVADWVAGGKSASGRLQPRSVHRGIPPVTRPSNPAPPLCRLDLRPYPIPQPLRGGVERARPFAAVEDLARGVEARRAADGLREKIERARVGRRGARGFHDFGRHGRAQ